MAKKDNTILIVAGIGIVAIYFLTKKNTPAAPVVTNNPGSAAAPSAGSILNSLFDSISSIFSSGPDVPSSGDQGQPVATTIDVNPITGTPVITPINYPSLPSDAPGLPNYYTYE